MEGKQTLSEESLRNAGASALYVAYYQAAVSRGTSTPSTNHAEKVVNRDVSYSGGGFHEALWSGDEVTALRSADARNAELLEEVTGKTRADTF